MFNPLKVINIINIQIIKLSSPISPNPNNVMPFLYLNPNEKSQVLNSLSILSQKGYKRISRKIINHKDTFLSTLDFNSHRTHEVHVKKIQRSKHIIPFMPIYYMSMLYAQKGQIEVRASSEGLFVGK